MCKFSTKLPLTSDKSIIYTQRERERVYVKKMTNRNNRPSCIAWFSQIWCERYKTSTGPLNLNTNRRSGLSFKNAETACILLKAVYCTSYWVQRFQLSAVKGPCDSVCFQNLNESLFFFLSLSLSFFSFFFS